MSRTSFPTDISLGFYGEKHTAVFLIWFIAAFVVIWCFLARFSDSELSLYLNVFDLVLLTFSFVAGLLLLKYTTALGNLLTAGCLALGLYLFVNHGSDTVNTLAKLFELNSKLNLFFTLFCTVCLFCLIIALLLKVMIRLFFLIPIKWFNHSYFLSLIRETVNAFITAGLLFFLYLFIVLTMLILVYNNYLSLAFLYDEWLVSSPGFEIFIRSVNNFTSLCLNEPLSSYVPLTYMGN